MIRHVALVGMPGSGKSTVGPLLAAALEMPFHDLDADIAARHGPIPAIFAAHGEAAFRAHERAALARRLAGAPCVIALGGGAFADPGTHALARRGARTIWLRATLDTLAARVGDGADRPLLAGDPAAALARLLEARADAYAAADHTLDADGDAAHIAARALTLLTAPAPAPARIPVGPPGYDVLVRPGLLDAAGGHVRAAGAWARALVVADGAVAPLYRDRLVASLADAGIAAEATTVAPGEASKSWEGLARLTDAFAAARLTRGDVVIALGGGVVGDLTGFAAAIWMRGFAWVQVPTTLLAQVDSSVGGKTAIDTPAGKNMIGAFHDPALVLADTDVLVTLPDREMRCGMAEVLKYGLIDHPRFFAWLEANTPAVLAREPVALTTAIAESVRAKARIVTDDPHEAGARALLNFGHTFGHALEAEAGFGDELKHGEAVAIGMALAFRFSAARGLCPAADAARVEAVLRAARLPTRLHDLARPVAADALVARMRGDKKAGSGGTLTLVLARGIGEAFVAREVDVRPVLAFLRDEGAG